MTTKSKQIGRRQFLVFSSTAIATAAVAPKLFGATLAAPKRLAIGYAPLDESSAASAASSIPAGDGKFIHRGARIAVLGTRLPSSDPRAMRTVDLLAHYSVMDGSERKDLPFRAWAGSRRNGGQGSPAIFNMPVDETQKLVFTVETQSGMPSGTAASRRDAFTAPTESKVLPLTLSLTSEEGSLKLVRGYYIIVPLFDNDSEPRWSAYAIRQVDGRWTLADRDGKAADFEHFLLRIDYAPES
ncbi:MAG TPA: hypothetical protein VF824_04205 [Thermoanaerobaculia bacterium]|jgi:hypothetical protein